MMEPQRRSCGPRRRCQPYPAVFEPFVQEPAPPVRYTPIVLPGALSEERDTFALYVSVRDGASLGSRRAAEACA